MTVAELIEALKAMPQDMTVLIDDDSLLRTPTHFNVGTFHSVDKGRGVASWYDHFEDDVASGVRCDWCEGSPATVPGVVIW
jgi:hypothetical protein